MSFFKKLFFSFTRREKITFVLAGAAAVVSFIALMGIVIAHATTAVPVAGGEYAEGVVGQPAYVNPVTASSEADLGLVKLIYSSVADDADLMRPSPDGKTWTVRLKDDLYWQDGQKLTSDDVIFTVQSIQDPGADSPRAASWQGVTVSRMSELEVQFTLANPYAFFGDDLKNLYVVPKHLFADVPPANWHLSDYNLKPVGSGPYRFDSYDKQADGFIDAYRLVAWDGSAAGRPLIQNFDFDFFRNSTDLISSFNAGTVDGFAAPSPIVPGGIDRPYTAWNWRTPGYYAIFFNQSESLALQDPAVRAALGEAVDRNALVAQALTGNGVPDAGPIPPDAPYYAPETATTSLETASETLDAAGWQMGADGFRSKTVAKSTIPLTVNLTVPQIDFLATTANMLQATWQGIGIQTVIATETPETIGGSTIQNRSYESLLFGNILGPSSDLYSFWDSSERFYPGLNLALYSDPTVDKLIESARENMDDASRTGQFAKIQKDIVADAPAVFLYSPDDLYIASKNLHGITGGILPDPSDRFREVKNWYLETTRVLK
jgi:peptide/nickel transport system substrate-binding protein